MNYLDKKLEIKSRYQPVSYKERTTTEGIIVHCSATQNKQTIDADTIDAMHRKRGFIGIGYHFVILTDGTVQEGRPVNSVGAHAKGYNSSTIGICLIGGIDKDGKSCMNFTAQQFESLDLLICHLLGSYGDLYVKGHRDLPNVHKDCPCFSVSKWYNKAKVVTLTTDMDFNEAFKMSYLSEKRFKQLNGEGPYSAGDHIIVDKSIMLNTEPPFSG